MSLKPVRDPWDYSKVPMWMNTTFNPTTGSHVVRVIHWQRFTEVYFSDHICVTDAIEFAYRLKKQLIDEAEQQQRILFAITARLKS